MNTNALLNESLNASITIEVNKRQLVRAACLLTIAQKAYKRYTEWKMYSNRYDVAYKRMEPWTFVNTKERTIKRATDASAAYVRLIQAYRKILFHLFTNKN
jgi:hypothetical protein